GSGLPGATINIISDEAAIRPFRIGDYASIGDSIVLVAMHVGNDLGSSFYNQGSSNADHVATKAALNNSQELIYRYRGIRRWSASTAVTPVTAANVDVEMTTFSVDYNVMQLAVIVVPGSVEVVSAYTVDGLDIDPADTRAAIPEILVPAVPDAVDGSIGLNMIVGHPIAGHGISSSSAAEQWWPRLPLTSDHIDSQPQGSYYMSLSTETPNGPLPQDVVTAVGRHVQCYAAMRVVVKGA
ncbi:MAG: hypothetical protein ACK5JR_15270, partial [Tropicimonas sp.]|uniref:hypothetical protein n=1 Tax=Tropicimonas sp. TaxID=2067044 RepID=UPI003A87DE98